MSRKKAAVDGYAIRESDTSPISKVQQKAILSLAQDTSHFSFIKSLHIADMITIMNGCCGVLSVFSSLKYCMGYQKIFLWYAILLQPTGAFFDFLDGKVARLREKSSLLGQELDSLADLISFGMAPAALAFTLGLMTPIDALGLAFFVLSGLSRLARFNVTASYLPKDATGKAKYFQGTPMPTTLFQCLIMSVWVWNDWYDVPPTSLLTHSKGIPLGRFGEGTWWEGHYVIAMFLLHGCAMLSRTLKVPKL